MDYTKFFKRRAAPEPEAVSVVNADILKLSLMDLSYISNPQIGFENSLGSDRYFVDFDGYQITKDGYTSYGVLRMHEDVLRSVPHNSQNRHFAERLLRDIEDRKALDGPNTPEI